MSTFTGKDLEAFRERFNLSRPDLQRITGMSRNSIWNYERDDADVPLVLRLALSAWLHNLPPLSRAPEAEQPASQTPKTKGKPPGKAQK